MSFNETNCFTKDNLDMYLKELAKIFRKLNGKTMPAEIILIGGAAILANYGFRDMTTDVDAVIHASSAMEDAIRIVRDKFDLPNGWLNSDFIHTSSYSAKLRQFSVYYRTFSNILTVRTVSGEYLIAMKLRSGRKYKKDLSDVVGILNEHEKSGKPITMDDIDRAVVDLYGNWEMFSDDSRKYIEDVIEKKNYLEAYEGVRLEELEAKKLLVQFEEQYPHVLSENNLDKILNNLKNSKDNSQ